MMLDNVGAEVSKQWAELIKSKYPECIVEVSGGISEQTISSYGSSFIDIVSMGSLTQDVMHVDFSMKIKI